MLYEFTETKNAKGRSTFRMKLTRGVWKFPVAVALSPNKEWVWLSVNLDDLPEAGKARIDILEKLLQNNADILPMCFNAAGRRLYLDMPIPVESVKPARLRRDLDDLLDTVVTTEPLWNPAKFPPPAVAKQIKKQSGSGE